MTCGCHLASNAGMWPEGVVDGLDRKGKLHCHLAFRSMCSRPATLLPTGIRPSALDSGQGVLSTSSQLHPGLLAHSPTPRSWDRDTLPLGHGLLPYLRQRIPTIIPSV